MKYIIESNSGGNNRILALQEDGTYRPIASCFGDFGNTVASVMVELANRNNDCGLCN